MSDEPVTLPRRLAARVWVLIRQWFWRTLAVSAVVVSAIVALHPFGDEYNPDAEDVATAWNDSIQRLGLLPLFPPTEDFFVGDVWAVIVEDDREKTPTDVGKSTLVGKAARIGYLDLRESMKAAYQHQPIFPETVEREAGKSFRKLDPYEIKDTISDGRIALTLAAFPGISITHKTRGAASSGWTLGGLVANREDQRIEEIRIPIAETYGAPVAAAFLALDGWCSAPKTSLYCTDGYVRRILAFAVHDGVLATKDNKYTTRIQLRLVNRVFLTREIQHKRLTAGAGSAAIQFGSDKARPASSSAVESAGAQSLEQRLNSMPPLTPQANDLTGVAGSLSSQFTAVRSGGFEIGINEVFQRPVVFGYKAITIDLEASKPAKANP